MENVSAVTSFILMGYTQLEYDRYLYFMGFLFLYIVTLLVNSVLLLVIYTERSLHEPMYLFICNLSANGVYGSTVLLPSMLGHLISQNYEVSVTNCLLQIYCLHLYAIVEYTTLAVMAYDRYVAICHPLQYHLLMSHRNAYIAIVLSWAIPSLYCAVYFIATVGNSFCGRILEKVYCSKFPVQALSCYDWSVENLVGIILLLVCPGSYFVLILYSYAHILRICLFASKESQIKALQTCTPHLVTLINFIVGCFYEVVHSSFDMSHVPSQVKIFLSLYFLIIPPLCNPVIYGMSIRVIKVKIFKLFVCKKS